MVKKLPQSAGEGSDGPLCAGDAAPDFTLASATGERVSLSDYRGRSEVVLYFYPRDNTAVCSAQACSFRDSFQNFRDAGALVIGISADSSDSHRRFAERLGLPFILLSDPDGTVRARYRVPRTLGLIPGRTTFVIDKNGVIRHVFSAQFRAGKHVTEALAALRKLRQ